MADPNTTASHAREPHPFSRIRIGSIAWPEGESALCDCCVKHVGPLVDVLSTIGQVRPLVVDSQHRLVWGHMWLAAIWRMEPEARHLSFDGSVAARVLAFDSEADPEVAKRVSFMEVHKTYGPREVKALDHLLERAGMAPMSRIRALAAITLMKQPAVRLMLKDAQ